MGGPRLSKGTQYEGIQESYELGRKRDEEERRLDAEAEEKRGHDLFKSGDLVKNTANNKIGVIIESGYRSWIQVFTDGETRKWPREYIEVINESR